MSYRNFRIHVLLRILVIALLMAGLIYFIMIEPDGIKIFFLSAFLISSIVSLFYYVDKTNNEVSGFLSAILNNDYTNKYSYSKKGKSFNVMYNSFNAVNSKMNKFSITNESQYVYISTLIKQIEIGIISFDAKNRIGLINDSMKELLGVNTLLRLTDLENLNADLCEAVKNIESGQSLLLKTTLGGQVKQLSIRASEFVLREEYYKLISIQDIKGELDTHEMEAWQKLIRVLTHEIMNSIAPIASLSNSLHQILEDNGKSVSDLKLLDQMLTGLDAIKARSNGLMKFTKDYRSLTRIPLPKLHQVDGKQFFREVSNLYQSTIGAGIQFELQLPSDDFVLNIDPDLISQVLINLLKNSKEAIESLNSTDGRITLKISQDKNTMISVIDNGAGFSDEVREQMFIPFFTSKNNGSGIGLSVVKQIVQLHKGTIDVLLHNGETTFQVIL